MKDKLFKVKMAGTLIKIIFSDKNIAHQDLILKSNQLDFGYMRNVYACFIK
jgi:hypothetical protein